MEAIFSMLLLLNTKLKLFFCPRISKSQVFHLVLTVGLIFLVQIIDSNEWWIVGHCKIVLRLYFWVKLSDFLEVE